MAQFFETRMGKTYYEGTLPKAVREITRLADGIEALNETLRRAPELPAAAPQADAGASRPRLLLVDDESRILRGLARALKKHCDVQTAGSVVQALRLLVAHHFDAIVSDCDMPGTSGGIALLEEVQASWPNTKRILMSGNPDNLGEHGRRGLVQRFLPKPITPEDVLACLESEDP